MEEELTTIDPIELCSTVSCNICYSKVIDRKNFRLVCCGCKNFTMCIDCFDIYTNRSTIEYAYCSDSKRNKVSCPMCGVPNGFAYWSLLFRDKPMPKLTIRKDLVIGVIVQGQTNAEVNY